MYKYTPPLECGLHLTIHIQRKRVWKLENGNFTVEKPSSHHLKPMKEYHQ